jgi:hypothetical protein
MLKRTFKIIIFPIVCILVILEYVGRLFSWWITGKANDDDDIADHFLNW